MRTLLLGTLCLLATYTALSQVSAGRYIVGADLGFRLTKFNEVDAAWSLTLNPNVLYLINDRLALGGDVLFSVRDDGFGDAFVQYGLAPSARYYLSDGGDGGLFADASLGITGTSIEGTGVNALIGLGVGYTIFFNDGLAIEPRFQLDLLPGDVSGFRIGITAGLQGFVDTLIPGR